jgi:hypothetical protein
MLLTSYQNDEPGVGVFTKTKRVTFRSPSVITYAAAIRW